MIHGKNIFDQIVRMMKKHIKTFWKLKQVNEMTTQPVAYQIKLI